MLEGRDSEPIREHIENVILNQYDRLRFEKSDVGAKTLVTVATSGHNKPQPAHPTSKRVKQNSTFEDE